MRSGREPRPVQDGYPRVVPDLVAEVASPSQGRAKLAAKAQRWLGSGARLVWVVLPETLTVEVWRPAEPVRSLGNEEALSGEEVLPGFTVPVAQLFPE